MTKSIITIVGMGKKIGLSIAKRFGKEGFAIVMIARNKDRLSKYAATLDDAGYENHLFIADATVETSLKNVFESIKSKIGDINVLVYNVSTARQQYILEDTFSNLVDDYRSNVAGALSSIQEVLPAMSKRGEGTILLTGGGFAVKPIPEFSSLAIGKAGLLNLTKSLALALKNSGIKIGIVTVCGVVNSDDPIYNPDAIAEKFWGLHINRDGETEIVY